MSLSIAPVLQDQWHDFLQFYAYLTHRIVPGPNSSCYFFPFLLIPAALLIPPSILSHNQLAVTFLPIIYACQIHAWYTAGIDVISINLTLWSFVLLVLRDPRVSYRRIWVVESESQTGGLDDGKGEGNFVEEPYPGSLKKRLPWVLTLLVSLRLAGWRVGDPSHDKTQPPPRLSRMEFLKVAVWTIIHGYFILDATSMYVQTDPYFHDAGVGVAEAFLAPGAHTPVWLFALKSLPPRVVRVSILAGQIYAIVPSMFFLPTIPAVGLNAIGLLPDEWSPHTWPVIFGEFSAVGQRGLRGLWGSWWHGMNRQVTATPGRSLAQALGIPTKSTLGFALLAVSAFVFSGVVHMGMIPPEPESKVLSAGVMRLYVAGFFWAQIPAFAIEFAAAAAISHYAPHVVEWRVARLLTLVWVAFILSLTLPLLTVPFREIGYWHVHAVPISLFQGLVGKGWVTWPFLTRDIGQI